VTFFESLLVLFALAILLLQVSRRLSVPYPSMLAGAGVIVALIPGTPDLRIAPSTALALFIAPVLLDAAYDYPIKAARALFAPLAVYAVGAVLLTAGAVGALGHLWLGLPIAAAITLGAIVAPPDAAAATAVLSNLPVSRRVDAVLKGESLFNDATTLLLFNAGVTITVSGMTGGGMTGGAVTGLALAVPGGVLFGIGYGLLVIRLQRYLDGTIGGTLVQFVHAFAAWVIAEHLHLSAVLAVVASAMTIANAAPRRDAPRMRVHSFAVWTTVVFLLNVVAFLLMGMQARIIFGTMAPGELVRAGWFAGAVVILVIVVRLLVAFLYRGFVVWRAKGRGAGPQISPAETLLVGWTGMRGLITMATAFALPRDFPDRDLLVLTAFAVVLATLVVQGATLVPLIRWLGLGREAEFERELADARHALAQAALTRLKDEPGEEAESLRVAYRDLLESEQDHAPIARRHGLALAAVVAQRRALEQLRDRHAIGPDQYLKLQEDLDWKELAVLGDEDRRIEES
jgi:NhaP-type Na+/H+ or K+/H+ antiporter